MGDYCVVQVLWCSASSMVSSAESYVDPVAMVVQLSCCRAEAEPEIQASVDVLAAAAAAAVVG